MIKFSQCVTTTPLFIGGVRRWRKCDFPCLGIGGANHNNIITALEPSWAMSFTPSRRTAVKRFISHKISFREKTISAYGFIMMLARHTSRISILSKVERSRYDKEKENRWPSGWNA